MAVSGAGSFNDDQSKRINDEFRKAVVVESKTSETGTTTLGRGVETNATPEEAPPQSRKVMPEGVHLSQVEIGRGNILRLRGETLRPLTVGGGRTSGDDGETGGVLKRPSRFQERSFVLDVRERDKEGQPDLRRIVEEGKVVQLDKGGETAIVSDAGTQTITTQSLLKGATQVDKTQIADLETLRTAAATSLASTAAGDKGYDSAADIVQNLMKSDLMAEVHQNLATKLADRDMSYATMDVIKNPGAYTTEQKTWMYLDLLYTKSRYETFKGEADKMRDGINNGKEIDEDFKQALAILGSDKDVQSNYIKLVLDAFKTRFNWGQLTPYENDDISDSINQREKKDAAMRPTLQAVVAAFDRDIVEGGLLKNAVAAGKDTKEILQEYQAALGTYMAILPEKKWFDVFRGSDPGLLTGASFDERMTKAEENYKEFFATHVIPNAPDAGSVFESIMNNKMKDLFGDKSKTILPDLLAGNLRLGGPVFDTIRVDVQGLNFVAGSDPNRKDGDGLKNLFRPTVDLMANLRFPDDYKDPSGLKVDVAAHRKAFTDAVLSQVDPLMERLAKGPMTDKELSDYLNGLTFTPSATAKQFNKQDMVQALRGLAMGASLMTKAPPDPSAMMGSTAGNFHSFSVSEVKAGLLSATGVAGASLKAFGAGPQDTAAQSAISKLFGAGTDGSAWSEGAFKLQVANTTSEVWDRSIKKMSNNVADTIRNLPGIEGTVGGPRIFTNEDRLEAISKIVSPSADALAASYFKENSPEAQTFSANMSTLLGAVWGLTKPGGDIHTLKANLTAMAEKGISQAPPGVELSRYRQMVVNGATTIVNALRTSWVADNNPNATWDMIGLGTLHAMGGLSALLKGSAAFAEKIKPHMESMLPGEPDPINAKRLALAKNLGTAGKVVGNAAAFGYAPIEIFQLAKELGSGKANPGDLAFMGIGTLADTALAVQGLAGLGEALINSSWASRGGAAASAAARAASAAAPFRFFSGIVASTAFTAASALSWIAWSGFAIWQLVKRENAYNKTKDALDADMGRLINTNMSFYDIKSRDTDRNGNPYKDDNAERVKTPEDWAAIRASVEGYRQSQGWEDWKIPA